MFVRITILTTYKLYVYKRINIHYLSASANEIFNPHSRAHLQGDIGRTDSFKRKECECQQRACQFVNRYNAYIHIMFVWPHDKITLMDLKRIHNFHPVIQICQKKYPDIHVVPTKHIPTSWLNLVLYEPQFSGFIMIGIVLKTTFIAATRTN